MAPIIRPVYASPCRLLVNLNDLAETLAPLLQYYCTDIISGLDSLLGQPTVSEITQSEHGQGTETLDADSELAWRNATSIEEYVDFLVCRQGLPCAPVPASTSRYTGQMQVCLTAIDLQALF